jgi:DNA-directed RNA polymerase specialized sigma24 family protein
MDLIRRLVAAAVRRWQGREPHEALSEAWLELRARYPQGRQIDPGDPLLRTIVYRSVSRYFTRSGGSKPAEWKSIPGEPGILGGDLDSRSPTPDQDLGNRELFDRCWSELARMGVRRREAVLCKVGLGRVETTAELARIWGTSLQNVHKHAKKGLEQLRRASGGLT